MSPRINRSGVSFEGDLPKQRDGEQVPREGFVEEALACAQAGDSYDDTSAWSYRDLQEECAYRELDGALNVAREELVARLRADDAGGSDG